MQYAPPQGRGIIIMNRYNSDNLPKFEASDSDIGYGMLTARLLIEGHQGHMDVTL